MKKVAGVADVDPDGLLLAGEVGFPLDPKQRGLGGRVGAVGRLPLGVGGVAAARADGVDPPLPAVVALLAIGPPLLFLGLALVASPAGGASTPPHLAHPLAGPVQRYVQEPLLGPRRRLLEGHDPQRRLPALRPSGQDRHALPGDEVLVLDLEDHPNGHGPYTLISTIGGPVLKSSSQAISSASRGLLPRWSAVRATSSPVPMAYTSSRTGVGWK